MASNYDISLVQGDTIRWAMYLKDQGGTAYNLGGCTLSLQVRKGYYPSPMVATYTANVPEGNTEAAFPDGLIGGLSASATGGTIYIAIGATYTSQLSPESVSKYDIQVVNPTGSVVTTILRGSITVLPEVTRI